MKIQRIIVTADDYGMCDAVGDIRIAVCLTLILKSNVWFTTLFDGGCIFPRGEDSMWLTDAKRNGLCFYVSKETIGTVSFEESTWYTGADEKYYYGKGAFYASAHSRTSYLWMLYFAIRTRNSGKFGFADKIKWMKAGRRGYGEMWSCSDYCTCQSTNKIYSAIGRLALC